MRLLLLLLALPLAACRSDAPIPEGYEPTVILVSIDGFRADYMDRFDVPNLREMARRGVSAPEGLIPVFPTKTFPNHYSIVTGLYPAHHGIVANTMYDPDRRSWFRISDREAVEDPFWWGGEPIWVTAEKQGQKAATFFWVGSEAPVQGIRPSYWFRHDGSVPGKDRVTQVLEWLDLPAAERPTLITLYFSNVDTQGHRHGPFSEEAAAAARETDALIGLLLQGVTERGLDSRVNTLVVSDHGMAQVDPDRLIYLEDYIRNDDGLIVTYSPNLSIRPRPGREAAIRRGLSGVAGLRLLDNADTETYHYARNDRIPAVIGLAEVGWTIASSREFRERGGPPSPGAHGYAPESPSMRALFVAQGPAFRTGLRVESFENIHLYQLMTGLLQLEPAPNDGNPAVTAGFLR